MTLTPVLIGGVPFKFHWEFGDDSTANIFGADNPTGVTDHVFEAPGAGATVYEVLLTVFDESLECIDTFSRDVEVMGCNGTCPRVTAVSAVSLACDPAGERRLVVLDATVSGAGASQFVWTFGDGESQTINSGEPSTSHWYAPGAYTVKISLSANGTCPASEVEREIQVEKCGDGGGNPPGGNGKKPGDDGGWEWGKLCPGLLAIWLAAYVTAWVLYYLAMDGAAGVSIAALGVALVAWSAVCCRKCMRNPLKCCRFIAWMILAHQIILTIYGILAGTEAITALNPVCSNFGAVCVAIEEFLGGDAVGNPIAWWGATLVGLAWSCRFVSAKCRGRYPVLLRPSTWPSSKC